MATEGSYLNNHGIELTIIIVNWNTADYLEKLLFSIFEKIIGDFYQVLVVDNDSKDGSREMVHEKFPGVILVNTGANLGYGKANNIGIKMARTPYILLLNPDTLVNSDAVPVMLDFLKSNDKIGAVQCALTDPDGTIQEMGLQWFDSPFTQFLTLFFLSNATKRIFRRFLPRQDPLKDGYLKHMSGDCILIRKTILDKVGGFDERFFMYAEDGDLSRRIILHGWKLFYLSKVSIVHVKAGASDKTFSNFSLLMMCESTFKYNLKYYGLSGALLYRFFVFLSSIFRILFFLISFPVFSFLHKKQICEKKIIKCIELTKWSLFVSKPIISS